MMESGHKLQAIRKGMEIMKQLYYEAGGRNFRVESIKLGHDKSDGYYDIGISWSMGSFVHQPKRIKSMIRLDGEKLLLMSINRSEDV